jgi:hypothetical protein
VALGQVFHQVLRSPLSVSCPGTKHLYPFSRQKHSEHVEQLNKVLLNVGERSTEAYCHIRCQVSGRKWWRWGPGSITAYSKWGLWFRKWHWDSFSEYFGISSHCYSIHDPLTFSSRNLLLIRETCEAWECKYVDAIGNRKVGTWNST